jgi:hypothetical protein
VSGLESCGEYPAGKGIAVHDVVDQNHETTGAETLLHDRSPCMLPSCLLKLTLLFQKKGIALFVSEKINDIPD